MILVRAWVVRMEESGNNDDDKQLVGKPNTINTKGYKTTYIGNDGKANYQQHNTSHSNPNVHSNPHGHNITWDPNNGFPIFGRAINDWGSTNKSNYTKGVEPMEWTAEYLYSIATSKTFEEYSFRTISDFNWCMIRGGEAQFEFQGKFYTLGKIERTFYFSEADKMKTHIEFETIEELLDYEIQNQKLREIITKVNVFDRTL